jgi:hypothetical protein
MALRSKFLSLILGDFAMPDELRSVNRRLTSLHDFFYVILPQPADEYFPNILCFQIPQSMLFALERAATSSIAPRKISHNLWLIESIITSASPLNPTSQLEWIYTILSQLHHAASYCNHGTAYFCCAGSC